MASFEGEEKNYEELRNFAYQEGASLFGVARIADLSPTHYALSAQTRAGLDKGICLALRLSDRVLEDIEDGPTKLYFFHYQRVNIFLDELALKITNFLQSKGWEALPIPASQIIDWENQRAHISHKHVAALAGLGWIGRNNLLVSHQFGARQRLITVLTNMPLKLDKPLPWGCGACQACLPVCPSQSIKERPEEFDHHGCFRMIRELVKKAGINQNICGLCVKACREKKPKYPLR